MVVIYLIYVHTASIIVHIPCKDYGKRQQNDAKGLGLHFWKRSIWSFSTKVSIQDVASSMSRDAIWISTIPKWMIILRVVHSCHLDGEIISRQFKD